MNADDTNNNASDDKFAKDDWHKPVAIKRDSNIIHWLIFLAVICFAVALWEPMQRLYWEFRNRSLKEVPGTQRTETCFVAISYSGIADDAKPGGPFTSAKTFKEHITALKKDGYTPITLRDVSDFYHKGRKLPKKAILLTFEEGRKSTYYATRDILLAEHWHAVMGIITRYVRENSHDHILRNYLHRMDLDATWELANQSDMGDTQILTSPSGNHNLFFTSPKWFRDENRREHLPEFIERIALDHTNSLHEFTHNLGYRPIAFFFPNGNYGQYDEHNNALREANLNFIEDNYELGFILNQIALNDANTDPRRLNRLIIPPETSAAELLRRLNNAWPFAIMRDRKEGKISTQRWIPDYGEFEIIDESYSLKASEAADPIYSNLGATEGGRSWIAGSGSFYDGSLEMRLRLVRGEFYLYLRSTADDNYIRIAITDKGSASISQMLPGIDSRLLATDSLKGESSFNTIHHLLVTIRDSIIFVMLDNELLFGGGVTITKTPPGMVGIGVWEKSTGLAGVIIDEAYMRARIDGIITWQPDLNSDVGYITRTLRENSSRYNIIAIPWLNVEQSSPLIYPNPDPEALKIAAEANNSKIYATLVVRDTSAIPRIGHTEIVKHIEEHGYHGLFIDAIDFPVEPAMMGVLKDRIKNIALALHEKGYAITIRFPNTIATHSAVSAFINTLPNATIASNDAVIPVGLSPALSLRRIEILPPATEADSSFFYQLCTICNYNAATDSKYAAIDQLRKDGLAAYAQADYQKAIELWGEWQKKNPNSHEPWEHIGNTYARLRLFREADTAYSNALEIAPGKINLVIERVRMLELLNKNEEARKLLDIYARAFPENPKITMEQAFWLNRRGMREQSIKLMRDIITDNA